MTSLSPCSAGYIDDPTADAYGINGDTLTLKVADRGIKLVDYRRSSFMSTGLRADEWINIVLAWSDLSANLDRGNFNHSLSVDGQKRRCGLSAWTRAAADGGWFFIDGWGCHVPGSDLVADRHRQHHRAGDHHDRQRGTADSVTWSTLATGIPIQWTPRVFGQPTPPFQRR